MPSRRNTGPRDHADGAGAVRLALGWSVLEGLGAALVLPTMVARQGEQPDLPGALILVVVGIAASWMFDLASRGVSITGPVPNGLPSLTVPDVSRSDLDTLALSAVAIFVVAFSDAILTARSFAARRHEVVDANQELLALGVAQVSAGVTQGLPVGTSGSRTAVNDDMGATRQVSGLAAAAMIGAHTVGRGPSAGSHRRRSNRIKDDMKEMAMLRGRRKERREERHGDGRVHYKMRQRLVSIGDDFWTETDSASGPTR